MPRDLTDLMERATSFAPPEPHLAADITRLAAQRQRRRTTSLVGGLAVVLVAAGVVGYGVTRGHATTPQPAVSYRYGQHQTLSDAVPSSDAPDFRTLDYDAPSVLPGKGHYAAEGEYAGVDAQGRLIALTVKRHGFYPEVSYRIVDGPGVTPRAVSAPPAQQAGPGGSRPWQLSFTGDDRLLWQPSGSSQLDNEGDVKLSDLDGSDVRSLTADTEKIPVHTLAGLGVVRRLWIDGDRAFFSIATRDNGSLKHPVEWDSLYSFDIDHPADLKPEEARKALQVDVSNGEAVWVDATGTKIYAEDLSSGDSHVVPVPLVDGCRIPSATSFFQGEQPLIRTNGDLVALTETCGKVMRVVVTDLSGRLVTDVDPGPKGALYGMALGARTLTFGSVNGATRWYADDLTTGTLVGLGRGNYQDVNNLPSSAGDYVLWYDSTGGHVGEFTG
jgi:hypothetical protein